MDTSQPTAPVSTTSVALRYGLLTGLVSIIFSLIQFMTHTDQSPLRWLGLIISIVGITLAHKEFKQRGDGFMSYGQGLGIGTLLSLIAGLMSAVFFYVYVTAIDATFVDHIMEVQRQQMEAKGLEEAQIDNAMEMSKPFMSPGVMSLFVILFSAFFGFIIALIVSAFTKNTRPEFE